MAIRSLCIRRMLSHHRCDKFSTLNSTIIGNLQLLDTRKKKRALSCPFLSSSAVVLVVLILAAVLVVVLVLIVVLILILVLVLLIHGVTSEIFFL